MDQVGGSRCGVSESGSQGLEGMTSSSWLLRRTFVVGVADSD